MGSLSRLFPGRPPRVGSAPATKTGFSVRIGSAGSGGCGGVLYWPRKNGGGRRPEESIFVIFFK